jgi:hypothetical protein
VSILVPIALFGWPVVVAFLFRALPPRRALIVSYLGAILFLPVYHYKIPGIVDYGKIACTSVGVVLGALLFDQATLFRFRPKWLDLPMIVWILCPIGSSMSNDLGIYDGISESFGVLSTWGIPYFMGRIYLSDARGLKEVAMALVVGGLIYVPLCVFESRMSPMLHMLVYGFHQQSWIETIRLGGWRPTVFMDHGLEVSLWLAFSTLSAFTLWITGAVKRLANRSMGMWAVLLGGVTILCRSSGAIILLVAGIATVLACRWSRRGAVFFLLLALPLVYVGARATGEWTGVGIVQEIAAVDSERAASLNYRLRAEDTLIQHALHRPGLGWAGWGRNRPTRFDPYVTAYAVDGLWIMELGKHGFVGLGAVLGVLLLPGFILILRLPRAGWVHPAPACAVILAVVLGLYMIDCLMNAMVNAMYLLGAGGLVGVLSTSVTRRQSAPLPNREPGPPPHVAPPGVAG